MISTRLSGVEYIRKETRRQLSGFRSSLRPVISEAGTAVQSFWVSGVHRCDKPLYPAVPITHCSRPRGMSILSLSRVTPNHPDPNLNSRCTVLEMLHRFRRTEKLFCKVPLPSTVLQCGGTQQSCHHPANRSWGVPGSTKAQRSCPACAHRGCSPKPWYSPAQAMWFWDSSNRLSSPETYSSNSLAWWADCFVIYPYYFLTAFLLLSHRLDIIF